MIKQIEADLMTTTASEDFKSNLMFGNRYVDKTEILVPLLRREHETTFFLRPRRFGKTLTLSMIRYFLENTQDEQLNAENRELFDGLKIMEAGEKYTSQMTSYPVINLTFQSVQGLNFESAYRSLIKVIQDLYLEKMYLLQNSVMKEFELNYYDRILYGKDKNGLEVTLEDFKVALKSMAVFLRKDSGKKVVVLIDEYDVPLEKAYQNGYYREMVDVIGQMLQNVLKTNSANLQFAVVTGCLRIAKEGIYTGLNNPEVNTVLSYGRNDFFGFTEEEVQKLLTDSGVGDHYDEVREWYDGYKFGDSVIYNPWSVIKHIEALNKKPSASPLIYWANTSSNSIIRDLAEHADSDIRDDIEKAMQGEEISFSYKENIVYNELYDKPDNVMNVLLSAGYLTATEFDGDTIWARIPNREVHKIFQDQISEWFNASLKSFDILQLYSAMELQNVDRIEEILNEKFLSSMSCYDTVEAFYHGILLALMQLNQSFDCVSNRESGNGRFDIRMKRKYPRDLAFILEAKIAKTPGRAQSAAQKGADQISKKNYVKELQREGYKKVITYGIAFCKKGSWVAKGQTFEFTKG